MPLCYWKVLEYLRVPFGKRVQTGKRLELVHPDLPKTMTTVSAQAVVFGHHLPTDDNGLTFLDYPHRFLYLLGSAPLFLLPLLVLNNGRFFFILIEFFRFHLKNPLLISHDSLINVLYLGWSHVSDGFNQSLPLAAISFVKKFGDNRFVSIFDHMLSSGVIEESYDIGPVRSVFLDILEQNFIFFRTPLSLFDPIVEMILVSLPALLGSLEKLAPGLKVEVFSNLVPLPFLEFSK